MKQENENDLSEIFYIMFHVFLPKSAYFVILQSKRSIIYTTFFYKKNYCFGCRENWNKNFWRHFPIMLKS